MYLHKGNMIKNRFEKVKYAKLHENIFSEILMGTSLPLGITWFLNVKESPLVSLIGSSSENKGLSQPDI